jgi:DNA polymerase
MVSIIAPGVKGVRDFMADPAYRSSIYPALPLDDPMLHWYAPPMPDIIKRALEEGWTFVAHNARFEQTIWYNICHKRWGWPMPKRWSCTAARARYWGLRASLEGAGSDLELHIQKEAQTGESFIKTFCIPRKYKGAKKNGIVVQLWAEPHELPDMWAKGLHYCLVDAEVEQLIDEALPDLPPFEQDVWDMDFAINTHGVPIDVDNVQKAMHFSEYYTQHAVQRFNAITSVNPTQRDRVLEYLNEREEMADKPLDDLRSKTLQRLDVSALPEELIDVINIRLDCSRASIKKLEGMSKAVSADYRARGTFLYYGAHTGRWSAKRMQTHNYIRGNAKTAQSMFEYLDSDVWERGLSNNGLPVWANVGDLLFPRPLKALSHSMRGFIKAPEDTVIFAGDYAQIEARVLAWLANCESLLRSFREGEDVYVRFAADHMYRRDYWDYFYETGKVRPEFAEERQRAKSAVLGAGFQLGGPGFQAYCDNMDIFISELEAKQIIATYRDAYPEISDWHHGLWARMQYCAIEAVSDESKPVYLHGTAIKFHVHRLDSERWWLLITLPSGRHIAYYRPRVEIGGKWNKPILSYRTEWMGKTYREQTYGGKLTENVVQAVARDICSTGALNVYRSGYSVFALIHDEIVSLAPKRTIEGSGGLKEAVAMYNDLLLSLPDTYAGLPLNAESKWLIRYGK